MFQRVQPKARVKVSSRFQIPKQIRQEFGLRAGEELQIFISEGTIHVRRPRTIKDLRGIALGSRGRTIIVTGVTDTEAIAVHAIWTTLGRAAYACSFS